MLASGDPKHAEMLVDTRDTITNDFQDYDSGGVYFNVLATGIPYLMGTERLKGSHSMSGYHSTELCYLSAVYSNLLVTKQPLDLHSKPKPGAFWDNVLRGSPDILPPGSIRIEEVWIDGDTAVVTLYGELDRAALDELSLALAFGLIGGLLAMRVPMPRSSGPCWPASP